MQTEHECLQCARHTELQDAAHRHGADEGWNQGANAGIGYRMQCSIVQESLLVSWVVGHLCVIVRKSALKPLAQLIRDLYFLLSINSHRIFPMVEVASCHPKAFFFPTE